MKTEEVRKLPVLERFLYWIKERRQIYLRRKAGKPKPWTDDEILQSYSFTNVYREDDKTTRWFRESIREPLRDKEEVFFATIAFRWFNYIPTGIILAPRLIKGDWDGQAVIGFLNELRKEDGRQLFTGAFNISNSGMTKPKLEGVVEDYIEPIWQIRHELYKKCVGGSLENAAKVLGPMRGFGGSGFMVAQVICDLKYTHVLEDAEDWWTWSSPGPGSKKGLNILMNKPLDHPSPKGREWHLALDNLRGIVQRRLAMKLHAQDVQNCLCEFFKMHNAMDGGHLRRRYAGR